MRSSAIGIRRAVAIAVALTALTLLAGTAPEARPLGVVAQASDDEEALPPEERTEENPRPRMGASRRLDPFDANDERKVPAQAVPAPAGAVICEAGCGGPRGVIVYQKK